MWNTNYIATFNSQQKRPSIIFGDSCMYYNEQDSTCNQREFQQGIPIAFKDHLIIVANKKLNDIKKNGDYYFNLSHHIKLTH